MALQDLRDPAIEPLDHAVGLRMLRRGWAAFYAQLTAKLTELVLAGGSALSHAEQTINELAVVIGQHLANADRAGFFQVA